MFKTLIDMPEQIEIYLDGKPVMVPAGISVAAAMLLLEALPTRHTAVSGSPRAPFCMMGICFDCLLEIDARLNQRACQFQVEAGMHVRRYAVAGQPES
jgi:predicted molibdopterin-dependent oxidoreductase YjgC